MVGTQKASACTWVEAEARHQPAAMVGLIATAALALSTIVAVTAVSIGIARADTFAMAMNADQVSLAITLLVTSLLTAMGGLTVAVARVRTWRREFN